MGAQLNLQGKQGKEFYINLTAANPIIKRPELTCTGG